jgi:glycosyltransferase involved in cell wall biosynthesis
MNIKDKLTIVIPCKNEVNYIGETILSLVKQMNIKGTRIIIVDAYSTDGTRELVTENIKMFSDILKIELVNGGLVAYARNYGASLAKTKFVLFLDADVQLIRNDTIDRTLFDMQHHHLDLLTCRIKSRSKSILSKVTFRLFNGINRIISHKTPFAVGTYFMVKKDMFIKNGMFNEELQHSEDYALSKTFNPSKFRISKHFITQDDRRFKKMGYIGMLKLVVKGYINRNNQDFYKTDVGYWV